MLGVGLGLAFGLGWIPLFLFRVEAVEPSLPHYDDRERRWVHLAHAIVAAHITLACIAVSVSHPPGWRALLGAAVFAAGLAVWFWGRRQIGPLRVTRTPDEPPAAFRRDGAFGLVRHPLYFGYLLAAAAPVIVAGRPLPVVTYAAGFAVLALRAVQEERRLHAQLGRAYADYCNEVRRLIPFVW